MKGSGKMEQCHNKELIGLVMHRPVREIRAQSSPSEVQTSAICTERSWQREEININTIISTMRTYYIEEQLEIKGVKKWIGESSVPTISNHVPMILFDQIVHSL